MDTDRPNFFSGPYIERRTEIRESADWLEAALADPRTRIVITRGTTHLMRRAPDLTIEFLPTSHSLLRELDPRRLVLLGWFRGARCVLAELDPQAPFEASPETGFEELRALAPGLPADEAGLLSYARALTIWRARHQHC